MPLSKILMGTMLYGGARGVGYLGRKRASEPRKAGIRIPPLCPEVAASSISATGEAGKRRGPTVHVALEEVGSTHQPYRLDTTTQRTSPSRKWDKPSYPMDSTPQAALGSELPRSPSTDSAARAARPSPNRDPPPLP